MVEVLYTIYSIYVLQEEIFFSFSHFHIFLFFHLFDQVMTIVNGNDPSANKNLEVKSTGVVRYDFCIYVRCIRSMYQFIYI